MIRQWIDYEHNVDKLFIYDIQPCEHCTIFTPSLFTHCGIISKGVIIYRCTGVKGHVDELAMIGTSRCWTHKYQSFSHSTCTNVDCIRY